MAAIALVSVGWLLAIFLFDAARFVIAAPEVRTGFEVLLAVGQLFGALLLAIFPDTRLRYAALGLLVLGSGALGFAYLYPIIDGSYTLEVMLYGSGFVRVAALALIARSLLPDHAPAPSRERVVAVFSAVVLTGILLAVFADELPPLLNVDNVDALAASEAGTLPGLSWIHWVLSPVPLVLGILVTAAAIRRNAGQWMVAALALFTGAQLHSIFWPSLYSSVLTSSSVLRLAFTLVIVTGGIFELRVLLGQRDALLAEEQERLLRLEELSRMKDDFTAIVAHELSSPVSAVSALAEVLALEDLAPEQRRGMADALQAEARMLHTLVADVKAVTAIERDDFHVHLRPVRIHDVIADVVAFASTLSHCRIEAEIDEGTGFVCADPDRIGQVLRNLLSNACKHTPPDTRVVIRARLNHRTVRVEVADDGPGIAPEDQQRIFDKFARGHDRERKRIRGRGLGLYISRRIVQLHGSDLEVESEPGHGACFAFDLEVAP